MAMDINEFWQTTLAIWDAADQLPRKRGAAEGPKVRESLVLFGDTKTLSYDSRPPWETSAPRGYLEDRQVAWFRRDALKNLDLPLANPDQVFDEKNNLYQRTTLHAQQAPAGARSSSSAAAFRSQTSRDARQRSKSSASRATRCWRYSTKSIVPCGCFPSSARTPVCPERSFSCPWCITACRWTRLPSESRKQRVEHRSRRATASAKLAVTEQRSRYSGVRAVRQISSPQSRHTERCSKRNGMRFSYGCRAADPRAGLGCDRTQS